jgi:hypothetical protein
MGGRRYSGRQGSPCRPVRSRCQPPRRTRESQSPCQFTLLKAASLLRSSAIETGMRATRKSKRDVDLEPRLPDDSGARKCRARWGRKAEVGARALEGKTPPVRIMQGHLPDLLSPYARGPTVWGATFRRSADEGPCPREYPRTP